MSFNLSLVFLIEPQSIELNTIDYDQLINNCSQTASVLVDFSDNHSQLLLGVLTYKLDRSIRILVLRGNGNGLSFDVLGFDVVGFENRENLGDLLCNFCCGLLGVFGCELGANGNNGDIRLYRCLSETVYIHDIIVTA